MTVGKMRVGEMRVYRQNETNPVVLVKSVPVIVYCSVRMATAWLAA